MYTSHSFIVYLKRNLAHFDVLSTLSTISKKYSMQVLEYILLMYLVLKVLSKYLNAHPLLKFGRFCIVVLNCPCN